jgi:hypothetical protein
MQLILLIGKTKIPRGATRRKLDSSTPLKAFRMNKRSKIQFRHLVVTIVDRHVTQQITFPPCILAFLNLLLIHRK